jgi:hypothetical protein
MALDHASGEVEYGADAGEKRELGRMDFAMAAAVMNLAVRAGL